MFVRIALISLLCVALTSWLGCFKSSTSQASSGSSSDSSRSSSRSSASSSGSSSASSREGPYMEDVGNYTSEWVLSGGNTESFRQGVAPIVEKNGITNWESDDSTYKGIGMGLKKSGVTGGRYQQLRDTLAGGNAEAAKWIDAGYK